MNTQSPFRTLQYYRFCAYGFLKNLRFFDAFLILILREVGFSYFQIGTLYALREITKNIFEIPSGLVADSFGRKNAIVFAFTTYLFSFVIFYFGNGFLLFALAMFLYGIGEAFRSGTHKAMILRYLELNNLKHLKTRFYGRTRSWSQLGSAVSSLLAIGILFWHHQYRVLFLFSTIPYVLDWINLITYPSELNRAVEQRAQKERLNWRQVVRSYFFQFKQVEQIRAFFNAASYGGLFKTMKDYLQPMLQHLALQAPLFLAFNPTQRTALLVGLAYFILYLLTSFSSRNAFKVEQRLKNLPRAIDGAYLIGVLLLSASGIAVLLRWPAIGAVLFVGLYLVQNIRRPLMVSYLSEVLPSHIMASGFSTASQLETVIIIVLSPVAGKLIDLFGLGWGIALVGALFLLLFAVVRLQGQPTLKKV